MKILNDTPFEVEALPLRGPEGRTVLTIIVKGTFDINPGKDAEAASEQIPLAFGDEFYDEKNGGSIKFESDVAPFKPRADIILVGKAYAPHGEPVHVLDVSLRVGQVKKTIRVIGDRRWKCSTILLPEHFSIPQPLAALIWKAGVIVRKIWQDEVSLQKSQKKLSTAPCYRTLKTRQILSNHGKIIPGRPVSVFAARRGCQGRTT